MERYARKNKLLNLIIPFSLPQIFLVSFLRRQESRKLKDWIPCQARIDRITDTLRCCRRMYLRCSKLNYLYCNKGVSLVEVMIALVVLLLVFVGLLQAALLGIDHNMRNLLREEAINVAAARLEEVRNEPFANVVSDTTALPGGVDCPNTFTNGERIQRTFRNITKDFCTNITCVDVDGDGNCATDDAASNTKRLNVRVTWRWKGEDFIQSATTLRRR